MFKLITKGILAFPLELSTLTYVIYDKVLSRIFPGLKCFRRKKILDYLDSDIETIKKGEISFKLYTPNLICSYRHATFLTKEPEIFEWIEEFGGGTFFDIGANVGIYTLFYALAKEGQVYSFEPSVFNLRQLAKNISINNLAERVTICSNPLSEATGVATFINGCTDEGGAMSAFGVKYGYDGKAISSTVSYKLIGFSLDDMFNNRLLTELPSLIKIDVDGIEHLILRGASKILRSKTLKSLYIEVNDDFKDQAQQVRAILEDVGFIMRDKRQSEIFLESQRFGRTYNQIWVRK